MPGSSAVHPPRENIPSSGAPAAALVGHSCDLTGIIPTVDANEVPQNTAAPPSSLPFPRRSRRSRQQLSSSAASLDCACTGLFQVSRRLYGCRSLRAPKATFSETAADIRLQFFPNTLRRPPPAAQTPPAGPHEPLLRPRPESRNGYKKRAAEKYPSPFSWLRLVQGLQITCNRAGSQPTSSADNP